MIINNMKAAYNAVQDTINYYVDLITAVPMPADALPQLVFFEDEDDKGEPVMCKATVLAINQKDKSATVMYANTTREEIFLSAINVDWLRVLAEKQHPVIEELLQQKDAYPSVLVYTEVIKYFVDMLGATESEARSLIGNKTGAEIIRLMSWFANFTFDPQDTITYQGNAYPCVRYRIFGIDFLLADERFSWVIIDPETGLPVNCEATAWDNNIQYYVDPYFWQKDTFAKKIFIYKHVYDCQI